MEYMETKRDNRTDMDPYYYAPEVPSSAHVLLMSHHAISLTCSTHISSMKCGAVAVIQVCGSKSMPGPAKHSSICVCPTIAVWCEDLPAPVFKTQMLQIKQGA